MSNRATLKGLAAFLTPNRTPRPLLSFLPTGTKYLVPVALALNHDQTASNDAERSAPPHGIAP